ncbi:E3 ubiquitin-protein ligase BRE1-like 1 isoform X2 [Actinidia eriantha]|uniref:E3 ubiquitin-protein ligase BRE1-like 1 isoform X1 n=1 Tax=Actinidia eriantha TaxID=165200 RepID=UPI0025902B28|nr:E3 ubiquitin-protein ligase BRE1-like 1 isoform X1 [Actinidia eriantha]XP_057495279.1 E3 ubiquitin-protein ligase BRE1-like 1 isoform X1 [Actinidia eriantha]XP_057495291.1 E3 ubiquitin-protein ligase BRE1-like 1 isoform X2 [Actinidia eriantha]
MAKGDKVLLSPGFIANCVPVYERERMENIRRNNEVYRSLGLKRITPSSVGLVQHKRSTTKAKCSNIELESTVAELYESNCNLEALKTDRDAANGAFFHVLNFANKPVAVDRPKGKQKDLQDMEFSLKELLDQASHRLLELQHLHEDRIGILKQLSDLQNTLKDVKGISSSQAYVLLRNQLAKSKVDLVQYQALFEKLQVEKDNLA